MFCSEKIANKNEIPLTIFIKQYLSMVVPKSQMKKKNMVGKEYEQTLAELKPAHHHSQANSLSKNQLH